MIMPGLKMTGSARSPDKAQIMNVASYKHRYQMAADRVNWRYTMNSETIMRINNDIELKTAGAGYDNCLCEVLAMVIKECEMEVRRNVYVTSLRDVESRIY